MKHVTHLKNTFLSHLKLNILLLFALTAFTSTFVAIKWHEAKTDSVVPNSNATASSKLSVLNEPSQGYKFGNSKNTTSSDQITTKTGNAIGLVPQPNTHFQSSSNENSTTTPTTDNSSPSVIPTNTTPSPTLPNCKYVTGPHNGENCPASPPSSWSYSSLYPCKYNGTYIGCPSYEDTVQIGSYTYESRDYCMFSFSIGYKVVQVHDYHNYTEIDCSTAIAI